MSLKYILFDLDGTLLPMNQDIFVERYFASLAEKLSCHGYEPESLVRAVWSGTSKMIKNDGIKTNERVFWDHFISVFGEKALNDIVLFNEFYLKDFDKIKASCSFTPKAAMTINKLKNMGLKLVLATNPIFPAVATEKRISWAGLKPDDFILYTTYENSSYSKPSPMYYKNIASMLGVDPTDCLMVGNDVSDDMPAESVGMKVFLLTDCLINKENIDISIYPNGSFDELIDYIGKILVN